MLVALVAFAFQTVHPLSPVLPPGVDPVLSQTVDRIAKLTEKGDFVGAKALLPLLPGRTVNIGWDDAAIPQASRFDFRNSRDSVLQEWQNRVPSATYKMSSASPDIRIVFDAAAQGANLVFSEDPKVARLTARLGLKEGAGQVDPATIHNEVSYVLGSYFGIAKLPLPGVVMSATESAAPGILQLSGAEASIATANISNCDEIRGAIARSVPILSGLPSLAEDTPPVVLGTVIQGAQVPYDFKVKNTGSRPLRIKIVPDCGCFATFPYKPIGPNETATAEVRMNTTEFSGVVNKTLYLLSNDPARPVQKVPFQITITPRYRMLPPPSIHVVDGDTLVATAYLFTPKDHPFSVTSAYAEGLPGEVTFSPWEGTMADPDHNEGPMPRKGYKFTLKMKNIPEGSQMGTSIVVATDDATFPRLSYPVFVQKGIIALPANVYLGEVGAAPRKVYSTLTRPGKPFKITKVVADSNHLTVSSEPAKSGDYTLTIAYDGKASKGDFHATVTVNTDDPKQPSLDISVAATVK
jgi:hypothetical protein